jgi:hypothetical protein
MDTSDAFSRIWSAFDAGHVLSSCAWCKRVRIDGTWLLPSPAALAAIDERYAFSHSVCDGCATAIAAAAGEPPAAAMPAQ